MNIYFNRNLHGLHRYLYLQYIALFCVLMLFTYGISVSLGYSLISKFDDLSQHLPIMIQYRSLMLQFLHHPTAGLIMWSWNLGLGSDILQTFSYYITGDPFAYLILLFPANHVTAGFQFIILLKLFCVGLSFCFFASHFRLSNRTILIGSIAYLSSGFVAYAANSQPFFLNPPILFPLLILNIEKLLQDRSIVCFVLFAALVLIDNFYFAYMIAAGAVIFLIFRYIFYYRNKMCWTRAVMKFSFGTVVSTLLASCFLVPDFLAVQNSSRAASRLFANGIHVYPLSYYLNLPNLALGGIYTGEFAVTTAGLSIVFLGLLFVIHQRKHYPVLFYSFLLTFILLLLPAFAAILNGFSGPANRWLFLLGLPCSLAVCFFVQNIGRLTSKDYAFYIISALAATGISIICSSLLRSYKDILGATIFLFIFVCLMFLKKIVKRRVLLHWILIASLINSIYCFNFSILPFGNGWLTNFLRRGSADALYHNQYGGWDKQLPADSFYRVSTVFGVQLGNDSSISNASLVSPLHSIDSYYSIQDGHAAQFSRDLENSQYAPNIPLSQLDNRSAALNFLGVKYIFANPNNSIPYGYTRVIDRPNSPNGLQLYETKNSLPLIFFQSQMINNRQYRQMNASQKEASLIQAAAIARGNSVAQQVDKQERSVHYQLYNEQNKPINPVSVSTHSANYQLKLTIPDPQKIKNTELHVRLSAIQYRQQSPTDIQNSSGFRSLLHIIKNKWLKPIPNPTWTIGFRTDNHMANLVQTSFLDFTNYFTLKNATVNLGYFRHIPGKIIVTLNNLGTYSFHIQLDALSCGKPYVQQVRKLQKNGIQDLRLGRNSVTGVIHAPQSGTIESSIPYSNGWTIKLNNHVRKAEKINDAFIGIPVDKRGSYHLKMTYRTPGLFVGTFLSLLTLLLLVAAFIVKLFIRQFENISLNSISL